MNSPKYTAYYRITLSGGNYTDQVVPKDAYSLLDAIAGQFAGWTDEDEHTLLYIKDKVTGEKIYPHCGRVNGHNK